MPRRQSHRSTGVFPYIFRCNTRCPPCSSRIYRKSAEISASLTAEGCFRLFDFQLRCFNNGIQRKFAEFPYLRRARQHRNLKFRCFNNVNNSAKRKYTHISGSAASNRGTHPQACRITSDPALVSLSCLHANASTFFLAPSNRTPPNRIPLKPSAPPSPLRAAPPSRHKSHPTP